MPPILHCVVRSPRQQPGDLGPAIPKLLLHCNDDPVLLLGPILFNDIWRQLVVPSFATLFCVSRLHARGNLAPVGAQTPSQTSAVVYLLACSRSAWRLGLLSPPSVVGTVQHWFGMPARLPSSAAHHVAAPFSEADNPLLQSILCASQFFSCEQSWPRVM